MGLYALCVAMFKKYLQYFYQVFYDWKSNLWVKYEGGGEGEKFSGMMVLKNVFEGRGGDFQEFFFFDDGVWKIFFFILLE